MKKLLVLLLTAAFLMSAMVGCEAAPAAPAPEASGR